MGPGLVFFFVEGDGEGDAEGVGGASGEAEGGAATCGFDAGEDGGFDDLVFAWDAESAFCVAAVDEA